MPSITDYSAPGIGTGESPTGIAGLGGAGFTAAGASTALGDIGGAVGGYFSMEGYDAEAGLYDAGAQAATQEAATQEVVGGLQEFQLKRQVGLTESAQRAAVARNGLEMAGSAADLMRESAQQGAQANANLVYSTNLKANQYKQQAEAEEAEAKAARNAGTGAMLGGVLKGAAGIAAIAGML